MVSGVLTIAFTAWSFGTRCMQTGIVQYGCVSAGRIVGMGCLLVACLHVYHPFLLISAILCRPVFESCLLLAVNELLLMLVLLGLRYGSGQKVSSRTHPVTLQVDRAKVASRNPDNME